MRGTLYPFFYNRANTLLMNERRIGVEVVRHSTVDVGAGAQD
jgi:hypothetical protein